MPRGDRGHRGRQRRPLAGEGDSSGRQWRRRTEATHHRATCRHHAGGAGHKQFFFQGFAQAAGHPEWVHDPRFEKYTERRRHWGELMDLAERWSRTLTKAQCQVVFERCGVPCSPYRTVAEAMADPQIAHRGALAEVSDAGGDFRVLNPPFRLSNAATGAGNHSPALGEHTVEEQRRAGLSVAEIAACAAGSGAS